jgi:hypothetical protein
MTTKGAEISIGLLNIVAGKNRDSIFLISKKSRPHLDVERGWSGANEHFPQQNSNWLEREALQLLYSVSCLLYLVYTW